MTAKKSNTDKYNNNREGERETNDSKRERGRKRTRSDRKGGGMGQGKARLLCCLEEGTRMGSDIYCWRQGEMVLGVLCLSGRLNVLCTKLCGPRAHWEI